MRSSQPGTWPSRTMTAPSTSTASPAADCYPCTLSRPHDSTLRRARATTGPFRDGERCATVQADVPGGEGVRTVVVRGSTVLVGLVVAALASCAGNDEPPVAQSVLGDDAITVGSFGFARERAARRDLQPGAGGGRLSRGTGLRARSTRARRAGAEHGLDRVAAGVRRQRAGLPQPEVERTERRRHRDARRAHRCARRHRRRRPGPGTGAEHQHVRRHAGDRTPSRPGEAQ